jgi:hypothetical protein
MYGRACKLTLYIHVVYVVSHATECHVQLILNNYTKPIISSSVGSWSLNGLLNLQRAILGVKIHWIEKLFISLESFWNVDV